LNLNRSWKQSGSVSSSSSSSDVSSTTTVSSPSPTSRRSLALVFPPLESRLPEGAAAAAVVQRQTSSSHPARYNSSVRLLLRNGYSTVGAATYLLWWARCGVLRYGARRVWWHVLEDPSQLVDNVVVDFVSRHPRRIVVTGVLEPQGVASHQRLHPALHEAEGHVLGAQPGFP
jgi:hypothetical protein